MTSFFRSMDRIHTHVMEFIQLSYAFHNLKYDTNTNLRLHLPLDFMPRKQLSSNLNG